MNNWLNYTKLYYDCIPPFRQLLFITFDLGLYSNSRYILVLHQTTCSSSQDTWVLESTAKKVSYKHEIAESYPGWKHIQYQLRWLFNNQNSELIKENERFESLTWNGKIVKSHAREVGIHCFIRWHPWRAKWVVKFSDLRCSQCR